MARVIATGAAPTSRAALAGNAIGAGVGQGLGAGYTQSRAADPFRRSILENYGPSPAVNAPDNRTPAQKLLFDAAQDPSSFAQLFASDRFDSLMASAQTAPELLTIGENTRGYVADPNAPGGYRKVIGTESGPEKVKSQIAAINKTTSEPVTLVRTDKGLAIQHTDANGQPNYEYVDSADYRKIVEQGTSKELGIKDFRNFREQEIAARNTINTSNDILQLLHENPDVNTLPARAATFIGDLQADAKALAGTFGVNFSEKALDPSSYEQEFNDLQIQNPRLQSLVTSLAFQAAAAAGQSGRSVSDKDVERFIREIGASSRNPDAFSTVLRDLQNRVRRRLEVTSQVLGVDPSGPLPDTFAPSEQAPGGPGGGGQSPGTPPPPEAPAPPGVSETEWQYMTPEERALFGGTPNGGG